MPTVYDAMPAQGRKDKLQERWAPLVRDVAIRAREIRGLGLRPWDDLSLCSREILKQWSPVGRRLWQSGLPEHRDALVRAWIWHYLDSHILSSSSSFGTTVSILTKTCSSVRRRGQVVPNSMDTTQEVAAFAAALRQLLQNTSPGPCVSRTPARNGPKSPNHQADVLSRIVNQLTQSALSAQACIQRMYPKAGVRIHPSTQLHDNKTPVFPLHQMPMILQYPRDIPPPGGPQQLIRRLVCSPMLVLSGIDGSMTVCPRPLDLATQAIGGDNRGFKDGGWKHPLDTLQQHAGGGRPQSAGSRRHEVAPWRLQHQAGWEGHQTRPRTRKLP